MASGLLQVDGTVDLAQFWPKGVPTLTRARFTSTGPRGAQS